MSINKLLRLKEFCGCDISDLQYDLTMDFRKMFEFSSVAQSERERDNCWDYTVDKLYPDLQCISSSQQN